MILKLRFGIIFLFICLLAVSLPGSQIVVDFFGVPACQECFEVELMIEGLEFEVDERVVINKYNLANPDHQELRAKFAKVYEVPEGQKDSIPLVFIGDRFFTYRTASVQALLGALVDFDPAIRQEMFDRVEELEDDVSVEFFERFSGFSVLVVAAAGLIDGVNPCAFVVLIFLVSYLYYVGRERREILVAGMFFALGIFGAYIAMGAGLMGAVGYLDRVSRVFQTIFYPAMTVFTGVLFVLSILDFFRMRYGNKKAVLELSPGLKRKTHEIIRKHARAKTIWLASLIAGVLISFVEFMCTGQIYLPTIVYMINRSDLVVQAVGFLIIYNLGFTAPIIAITLIAYYGSSTKKIQKFMTSTNAAAKIKLIMGGVFLVFFVVILGVTLRIFGMI